MSVNLSLISEADLKRVVSQYLQIGEAQGKWMFLRLNAGMLVTESKGQKRVITLCRPGTADYLVLMRRRVMVLGLSGEKEFITCCTIFLELKAPGKKQTEAQREFQEAIENQGAEYYLIDNLEILKEVIR